jgi:nucleotide-binding universal stress UspA family protein
MSIIRQPSFVVVVGLDASPQASDVLAMAVASARGRPGASLHIVTVLDTGIYGLPGLVDEARQFLDRMDAQAAGSAERVHTHLCLGTPWREIVQVATNTQADLIVVGTHGRGPVGRLLLGSQAELVVRKASCQVLVVRPKDYGEAAVPEIEPPCPDCVSAQNASAGAQLWCARHAQTHPTPHRHYEYPGSFGMGSQLIRP